VNLQPYTRGVSFLGSLDYGESFDREGKKEKKEKKKKRRRRGELCSK